MKDTYLTIKDPAEGVFKDKGSRFLAFAKPVTTEEEIKQQLDDLRKRYHDARHHCYAWRLGSDMDRFRINDDGEPSGTAGNPILGQIRSRKLTNILVVVVRYFGGTLLGTGGLINAYRTAASEALGNAGIVSKRVSREWKLEFGYPEMNQVMKIIKEREMVMEEQQFDLRCLVRVRIWRKHEDQAVAQLSRIKDCTIVLLG